MKFRHQWSIALLQYVRSWRWCACHKGAPLQWKQAAFIMFTMCHEQVWSFSLFRVAAKKILSWLRFSLSQSPLIFSQDTWNKILFPIFHNSLNMGLLSFARWWMYTEREHAKHVLKERFYSNYFTCYSDTDTQGSQEFLSNFLFTCRHFNMVQISNDCMCLS